MLPPMMLPMVDGEEIIHKDAWDIQPIHLRLGDAEKLSGSGCIVGIALGKETEWQVEHIGDAMLEATGDEDPDREKDAGDFADGVLSGGGEEDGETDEEVAPDAAKERWPKSEADLADGGFDGVSTHARAGKIELVHGVDGDCQEHSADGIGDGNIDEILGDAAETDLASRNAEHVETAAGQELGACKHDGDQPDWEGWRR